MTMPVLDCGSCAFDPLSQDADSLSDANTTLADLLRTVPPLLQSCILCNGGQQPQMCTTNQLRLVSKEIKCLVLKASRRCTVHLGSTAGMTPADTVRLIKSINIEHLKLNIITTRGEGSAWMPLWIPTDVWGHCTFQPQAGNHVWIANLSLCVRTHKSMLL